MKPSAARRRVAIVASYAPSLTLFRGPLIRAILARGHAVLCVAPDLDQATEQALTRWGAECRTLPLSRTGLSPIADLATLRALRALFREWKPDTVMGYTAKPAIYASLAARAVGVAHIVPMITGLGYAYLAGGGMKRALVRQVMTRLYARALAASTGVVFHNRDDARVLQDLGAVPSRLPVTISRGSGIDLQRFGAEPMPPTDDGLTFLMIARLVRYKGVAEYCEAAEQLKARGARARWLLVGPEETGPAGYPVEALERDGAAVCYLGPQQDVRPALRQAHVYVLPSYGEGMPRTVLEALATGRPVITCDTRGCRETVQPGVNGTLIPVGDAAALVEAMAAFLDAPERIAEMGRASRSIAEAEFDVEAVNATMLEALGLDRAPAPQAE